MTTLALAVAFTSSAWAQDPVASGATFTIKDISTADGYYSKRAELVGKECTATGALTVTPGTTWYGGPATCGAATYYFYQIALTPKAAFGSATVAAMPPGTPFTIRDVSTADAYYASKAQLVGLACTAGSGMARSEGAWWSGPAKCTATASFGTDYYFYQVAFDITGTAPEPVGGGFGSATVAAMPSGTSFTVRDIHSEDAYFSSKSTIVGLSCIAGADMYRTDGPWWAGSATCNGNSFYFYKMAFDPSGVVATATATYGSATAPDTMYPPTQVTIRDIHADDLYATNRSTMVGLTCTVAADIHRNDGQWYGGDVNCSNGSYYYFYKFAFDVVGTPVTSAPAVVGDTLYPPTRFTIRDISSDDAYFADRGRIVGLTCTVNGDLHRNDGDWYGGGADCSDGTYYYFYKMAFDVVGGTSGGYASTSAPYAIDAGTSFVIRDIASDDAYFSSRSSMVGVSCTVGASGLTRTEGAWYGGDATCSNGSYYYFYKMAWDYGEGGSSGAGDTVYAGTSLTIRDIAADDAYFSDRSQIIGRSCTVANSLTRTDGKWYGGDVNCGSDYYYFYKMAFDLGGSGGVSVYSVPKKTRVFISDVGPDDAYYAYKGALIDQECQVKKGGLVSSGDPWYSGTLKCGGTKLYFYQVSVRYY